MIIQHNMQAMNASRMLNVTASSQAKNTEKLSSGYRINRAADDAAGLSISEKMRKQIRGLSQASTNAQDGISAVQTAEGALTEVHSMLQRMNELAVQSANGTNSETDRQAIQDEIDQLTKEIDRVSETTKFNETYLLKGEGIKTTETVTNSYSYKAASAGGISVNKDNLPDTYTISRKNEVQQGITVDTANGDGKDWYILNVAEQTCVQINTLTNATIGDYFELDDAGAIQLKAGYQINTAAPNTATEWGAQLSATKKEVSDLTGGTTATLAVSTVNGIYTDSNCTTLAEDADIKAAFGTDGTYTTPLYSKDSTGASVEIGADRIREFVDITKDEIHATLSDGTDVLIDENITDDDLAKVYKEDGTLQDGVQLFSVAQNTTDQFGDQLKTTNITANASNYVTIASNVLYDADGNEVSAEELADYYDGETYQGGLHAYNDDGELKEIGYEQISSFVEAKTETSSTESRLALTLDLHVGADSADTNKIKLDIQSMDATTLGIRDADGNALSVKTADDATASIDIIAAAIAQVSAQRSELGAVQNRLEHTIANLDNVVENTTAAESRIRDTDMASVMVEYAKNNILQQAGQSMLAQANQSTQGVLSLLQ